MSSPASRQGKAVCQICRHFRSAPYEARFEGCYLEKNMVSKQKQLCLDEQQLPGDQRHSPVCLRPQGLVTAPAAGHVN